MRTHSIIQLRLRADRLEVEFLPGYDSLISAMCPPSLDAVEVTTDPENNTITMPKDQFLQAIKVINQFLLETDR